MKYSEKQKLDAVEAYLNGDRGLRGTAMSQGVGFDVLRQWVAVFREHGKLGLQRRNQRREYTLEFKLEVLNRVRDEGLSHREVAAIYDIRRLNMIGTWKRRFAKDGFKGLSAMPSGPRKKAQTTAEPNIGKLHDDSTLSREQLLDELQQLRMEVAYLKKAEALVRSKSLSAPKNGRE